MSYWIYLDNKSGPVPVENHAEGGTYAIGVINRAEVNVTYNYAKHYDFRSLNGKKARDTAPSMRYAIETLGTERTSDYWDPTPGNVGSTLALLLSWAEQHPEAIWDVH